MNRHIAGQVDEANQPGAIAERWLADFSRALDTGDLEALADLFIEDAYWRDLLACQWDFRSIKGRELICARLVNEASQSGLREFAVDHRYSPPHWETRAGKRVIEVIVAFSTGIGTGNGVVRLEPVEGGQRPYRAMGLMTSLQGLNGYPEAVDDNRRERVAVRNPGENWIDQIERSGRFDGEEPEVMVVGAGHSGLMIAARLQAMGVRTLVVEKSPRVGDIWRNRYHTLQLHNEIFTIDFPYTSFPRNWPVYLPKDMYAAWLEFYATAMELAVWTSVGFAGATYDEDDGRWTAQLTMADGSTRPIRPRHIVLATGGVSGRKFYPKLPGLQSFAGTVAHSADVRPTDEYRGRKAIVVGTSTSGHDVALELHQRGCDVTMVQRGPTNVISIEPANTIYALYKEGRSIDEVDIVSIASDLPTTMYAFREFARRGERHDSDLLEGLRKVGFRLDPGYMEGGYFANYLNRGGGYYIDVGASPHLVDGRIKLAQNDEVERYEANGARLRDGSLIEADIVVLATGYLNQEADIDAYFGPAIAKRVGKVWGWDEAGELRRAWRPTGQRGLWLQLGGVPQSRTYSKLLALQIVAELRGIKDC
ncbi:flavin-containing monooxygenase [Microvirga antarctica]|uniref:flavin-containing monooxygenase n=1 Tax=Microvirga antarctica TaxID=2819233 RepID=UPI001B306214|nr:NAD(P)/FAD-dependent oxidoreductase [Microvirga antarctica]